MSEQRSKFANVGFNRPSINRDSQAATPPVQTNSTQLNDDDLIAHIENLAPPPKLLAKQRLEKLIPALAKARRNGNSVQSLAVTLKANGIDVSHVTLRKKLDAYEKTPERSGRYQP